MSYEQAIKHFKNHSKDRYYQQCGGGTSLWINKPQKILSNFQRFQNRIRACKGIWAGEHIYFNQSRNEYIASYYPKYPKHTCDDYIIVENRITKEICLYAPYITEFSIVKHKYKKWIGNEIHLYVPYATEFGTIECKYENWFEAWKGFKKCNMIIDFA